MSAARRRPLGVGERAPDFTLPAASGAPTRFYGVAGGAACALVFDDAGADVSALALPVFLVAPAPRLQGGAVVRAFLDAGDAVRAQYGAAGGEPIAFVLDANLRVLAALPRAEWTRAAAIARDGERAVQAPVLLVSNVLDAEICSVLMQIFEERGSHETGVEEGYGADRGEVLRGEAKRRRDHVVEDPDLTRDLTSTIGRRVIPEVQKAFAYAATRFEGFKIARYDAPDGHFHAHRDNLSPTTRHRRFALTLNLNDGYEGGALRFPEYGPTLYRPEAGGALLFSCSLLHEVVPVTSGNRFVLLSFLFGEEGDRARQGEKLR